MSTRADLLGELAVLNVIDLERHKRIRLVAIFITTKANDSWRSTGTNYGPCCSDYGWCGDGPDYCTPLYCQADYGTCG